MAYYQNKSCFFIPFFSVEKNGKSIFFSQEPFFGKKFSLPFRQGHEEKNRKREKFSTGFHRFFTMFFTLLLNLADKTGNGIFQFGIVLDFLFNVFDCGKNGRMILRKIPRNLD